MEGGIINVFKPKGISSFTVIRRLRKNFTKKMGHVGTLDPCAEGVLPIFYGKMTKLIPWVNQLDKEYQTTVFLGASSTTGDQEGEIKEVPMPSNLDLEEIKKVIKSFEGEIEQTPHRFSAIKKQGVPLYKYARKGVDVEIKPRKVLIYKISDIKIELPRIFMKVHCSKGTYIRSLAEDIGKKLRTHAYIESLTRTRCGKAFTIQNSLSIEKLLQIDSISIGNSLFLLKKVFPNIMQITIEDYLCDKLQHGVCVDILWDSLTEQPKIEDKDPFFVFTKSKELLAIARVERHSSIARIIPLKVLL